MSLYVTGHAVERFVDHWRRDTPMDVARAELEAMTATAAVTKRRTIKGDAVVWIAQSVAGEAVSLAVRDGAVITVFGTSGPDGRPVMDRSEDPELLDESAETIRACRAMAGLPPLQRERERTAVQSPDAQRRGDAESLLHHWRRGQHFGSRAVRRAHEVLGLTYTGKR